MYIWQQCALPETRAWLAREKLWLLARLSGCLDTPLLPWDTPRIPDKAAEANTGASPSLAYPTWVPLLYARACVTSHYHAISFIYTFFCFLNGMRTVGNLILREEEKLMHFGYNFLLTVFLFSDLTSVGKVAKVRQDAVATPIISVKYVHLNKSEREHVTVCLRTHFLPTYSM